VIINKFKNRLLRSSRLKKQILAAVNDFFFFFLATYLAISVSQNTFFSLDYDLVLRLIWVPSFGVIILSILGIYNSVVRFLEFSTIYRLSWSLTLFFLINVVASIYFGDYLKGLVPFLFLQEIDIKIETWTLGYLFSVVFIIGSRVFANRFFISKTAEKRVVIYGAGSAGIQLAGALKVSPEMQPIAFLDDNEAVQGTLVGGIKVFKPKRLKDLLSKERIDEVLIAMPSQPKSSLKSILKEIEEYSVKVRILPGVAELAQGKISVSELKEVDIEDLLGREEVMANQNLINKHIKEKVVMVTGAGGSIGAEISRQIIRNNPKLLIILDVSEFSLYSIKQELLEEQSSVRIESILGNVNDKARIKKVCETFEVQTIYHAAAYKHVPLVEENPFEAVSNNIFGTLNCALAAEESKVETFVFISTDKAVRPTNIMGATKRFAELILQSLAKKENNFTKISMVRFGNVLGSSGSAIPLFQKQIKEGGPLTVTDPEVIRYFMSISEAAELVIQAGAMGKGGEVFVLDMGEPVRILELAERLIKLSGMEVKSINNPQGDIEIIFTGLRPGEKLFEELLIGDDVESTDHKQIYKANEDFLPWERVKRNLDLLEEARFFSDNETLKNIFKKTVSGYKPEKAIIDVTYLESQQKEK